MVPLHGNWPVAVAPESGLLVFERWRLCSLVPPVVLPGIPMSTATTR